MTMLECIDKELSISDKELLISDKELSISVYLGSKNNMIEKYKDDIIHALCSIKISCDKRTIVHVVYYVKSDYRSSHNLGSHNILLETNYDLWATMEILGPLPTLCEPTRSYT